eukprot:TRINITY_DN5505_c0_g1_i5.p1 TRINITY_DN5505_c0_g1~~TRINITY_DN5505_c0_g1_i5.p1  ORF type:complete len:166 (-),score=43.09 TRINITY_DN5505_c0_g1_i5:47-544(-)
MMPPRPPELALRRQERERERQSELDAARAFLLQQRQEYERDVQFLQSYSFSTQRQAQEQQVWSAGAERRQIAQTKEQAALHAELQDAQVELADTQARLYASRNSHKEEKVAAEQLQRTIRFDLATLRQRLQTSELAGKAAENTVAQLRLSLRAEQAYVAAEAAFG